VPPSEKGMFISSLLGSKLGISVTLPLMALITDVFGWQWAFYFTALFSFMMSILWYNIVADSPEKHPNISKSEKDFIEDSLEHVITKKPELPPITKMFKSMPFYALLFLHFSDVWGVFFLMTSAPMFMSQVLKFDLKDAGMLSSLPYIARLIFGFLFGIIGDYFISQGFGATRIRKMFCIVCKLIQKIEANMKVIFFLYFSSYNPRNSSLWILFCGK
jgi:MFS transporter, ACS family, solute carrier family 17 (sodium-dependent inorganic phosphate cotransporter), other